MIHELGDQGLKVTFVSDTLFSLVQPWISYSIQLFLIPKMVRMTSDGSLYIYTHSPLWFMSWEAKIWMSYFVSDNEGNYRVATLCRKSSECISLLITSGNKNLSGAVTAHTAGIPTHSNSALKIHNESPIFIQTTKIKQSCVIFFQTHGEFDAARPMDNFTEIWY